MNTFLNRARRRLPVRAARLAKSAREAATQAAPQVTALDPAARKSGAAPRGRRSAGALALVGIVAVVGIGAAATVGAVVMRDGEPGPEAVAAEAGIERAATQANADAAAAEPREIAAADAQTTGKRDDRLAPDEGQATGAQANDMQANEMQANGMQANGMQASSGQAGDPADTALPAGSSRFGSGRPGENAPPIETAKLVPDDDMSPATELDPASTGAIPQNDGSDVAVAETEADVVKMERKLASAGDGDFALPDGSEAHLAKARALKWVNMRAGPDQEAKTLTIVPADADLMVDPECNGWCAVVYKGQKGYIYETFIRGEEGTTTSLANNG